MYCIIYSWAIVLCLFSLSLVLTNYIKFKKIRVLIEQKRTLLLSVSILIILAIVNWFGILILEIKPKDLYINYFDAQIPIFSVILLHMDLNIPKVEIYNRCIRMKTIKFVKNIL